MRFPRWLKYGLGTFGAVLVGGTGYVAWPIVFPPPNITVASWGEDYGRAQMVAMFHPFTDETGVDVDTTIYGGGLDDIRRQVESGMIEWNVVDFELADAQAACREGLLEPLSDIELPPGVNGTRAVADFVPGAVGPCWVGTSVYSQIIAYNPKTFSEAPTTPADFFDLVRFPGARGIRDNGPMYNLELALLADGVGLVNVYPTLATKEGVDRAFAKLDTIKDSLRWWKRLNDPVDWIERGDVVMSTVLNGRVFEAVVAGKDIAPVWNGQLYQMDVFGIPKGSANLEEARDLIRFATSSGPQAAQANWLPYGPARRSAIALMGNHPVRGTVMRPFMPTAPENFTNALAINPGWWAEHGAAIKERWAAWRVPSE